MPGISIDTNLCKRDGLCTLACPVGIFQQEETDAVPKLARVEACIGCGHCVAICPHDAISHSDYPTGSVGTIRSDQVPTYDQVLELVRCRRSKRRFKDTAVEKDVIEKVLEAARFAPSGHNAQPTEFIVIQDKATLHEIGGLTVAALEKMMRPFTSPVGRMVMRFVVGRRRTEALAPFASEMAGMAEIFNSGRDLILNDAPVLILFCADSAGISPSVDVNLALQNATLAAEALGLGCFYGGFVLAACSRDKRIPKLVSLPETHQVYGTLALGYPRLKFSKWPERKPVRVNWM
jgi:nitroreductase/NAD-dependent dihydropyrimidine dehydrogenase PreA subunit